MDRQHHLPTEIILEFGELLDGPSLRASLQVCREWHRVLSRLVWATITKTHWCHPSFPIHESTMRLAPFSTKDEELKAVRILSCLQYTQVFEWKDIRTSRRSDGGGHDPAGTRILVSRVPFPSQPPIHRWMPNLTQFSLILPHNGPSDADLLSILDPSNLRNLQALVLDLPTKSPRIRIDKLFPLFLTLKELRIYGLWYCSPDFDDTDTDTDTDTALEPDAAIVPADALPPLKLQRLAVDWVLDSLFKKCLALEHLTIKRPIILRRTPQRRQEFCALLHQMPNLRVITLKKKSVVEADEFKIQTPIRLPSLSSGPHPLWKRTTKTYGEVEGTDWTLEGIVKRLYR